MFEWIVVAEQLLDFVVAVGLILTWLPEFGSCLSHTNYDLLALIFESSCLSLLYARQPNFNLLICSEIKSTPSHTHRITQRDTDIICSVLGHSTRSHFDSTLLFLFSLAAVRILFHLRVSIWIFYQRSEFISQIGFDYTHVRIEPWLSLSICVSGNVWVSAAEFPMKSEYDYGCGFSFRCVNIFASTISGSIIITNNIIRAPYDVWSSNAILQWQQN